MLCLLQVDERGHMSQREKAGAFTLTNENQYHDIYKGE